MLSVLAIEIDGLTLRTAVVKRGFRGYSVSDCHTIVREREEEAVDPDELPTSGELQSLLARLGKPPRWVVLVSQRGALVDVFIPAAQMRKLRADQLKDMLRWEVEPYTGLPAPEMLVGYEINKKRVVSYIDKDVRDQDEIRVTAFPREEYQELKSLLAQQKLKLKRLYLPEQCFPLAALYGGLEEDQVVVDVGWQVTRAALLKEGRPATYRTASLGYQAIKMHLDGLDDEMLEPTLRELLDWGLDGGDTILVSGPGGADPGVLDFFRERLGVQAVPLEITSGEVVAGEEFKSAEFAVVVGAGLRELRFARFDRRVGIDDTIPVTKLIRERVHILPIAVVAVILLLFLSHYGYLLFQVRSTEAKIAQGSTELAEIKSATARFQELQAELTQLSGQRGLVEVKLAFLGTGLGDEMWRLQLFLAALARDLPRGVVLHNAVPLEGDRYLVNGESITARSITNLALILQNQPWCAYTRVNSIERIETTETVAPAVEGGEPLERVIVIYRFELLVSLEGGEGG